jgi:hypothetical protein
MKRKIVAALCASLVLSMGSMTAMAAGSSGTGADGAGSSTTTNTGDGEVAVSGTLTGKLTVSQGYKISEYKGETTEQKAVLSALDTYVQNASTSTTETKLLATMDITREGATVVGKNTYNVVLYNDGIVSGGTYSVLHYVNGKWVTLSALAGDGFVSFLVDGDNFSPFALVQTTKKSSSDTATSGKTSPTTGATTSVAAIASLVSLASAAYAKKRYDEE